MNDLRYAIRQLTKHPGFTAVAILTLALGIGPCAAIFSVVNGVLLRPLDYPQPDRIVIIRETNLPKFREFAVAPANFSDWQKQAKSFSALAAYAGTACNFTGGGEPQRLSGVKATADYFAVFGIQPVFGRLFGAEEDAPGKNHVAVLSYAFWQRAFAGDRGIIGRTLQLNGETYTVIGVAPRTFGQSSHADLWTPMAFEASELSNENRGSHYVTAVGRLKPGVSAVAANAELNVIASQLAKQYPSTNKGWAVLVAPMLDYVVGDVRVALYTLFAGVGCVLLIACANIANLLLARATARQRELSIRAALGAGRWRLAKQFLSESLLLSLCGGTAGLLVGQWSLDALLAIAPADLPRTSSIHLDAVVVIFCIILSCVTGIIFGVAPAWLAAHADLNESLKEAGRGSTDARGRFRGALVIAEVAFALVLLGGAGLLGRSFLRLVHVDPGFNPAHATVMRIALTPKKYINPEQQIAFVDALLDRLRALPGVEAVGLTQSMPLISDWVNAFTIEGRPPTTAGDEASTNWYCVTPGYFRAMGIRLLRGRLFTEQDNAQAADVAIINETLARQYFPNEEPLGKRIKFGFRSAKWSEIVGIVGDVKQYGVDKTTPNQTYNPFAQHPGLTLNVVLRTSGSPPTLTGALRAAVYDVDKDQPVGTIRPLESIMAETIAKQRFTFTLVLTFAAVAIVIALVGIYGVMAYTVAQRTNEIGIRMALGAQKRDVLQLVLRHGGKLIAAGLLAGLIATIASSRAIKSILFQTSASDPFTLGAITLLLGIVAVAACLLPAYRATKVNPILALRRE